MPTDALAESGSASEANVQPLANELVQALLTAKVELATAQNVTSGDIISEVAGIIEGVIDVSQLRRTRRFE